MEKINDEYDIKTAFEAIENELIESMIRNMRRHKVEEVDEDKQWSMWQAEQLKNLEKYRRTNQDKFGTDFKKINARIEALIKLAHDEGEMEQEIAILNAIKRGYTGRKRAAGATAEFFRVNERKLDALIDATMNDMQRAETAILRMADDQYRKVIYNAQVYANTGAGTYEKAVDMATEDFLKSGLNCIEYVNGARHTLKDYADMAIRTASKRAYLQGEGQKRQEWGITTVIMNKRGNPCPKCLPFCGKVLIDDVWSGGRSDGVDPATGKKYPTMSYAISKGLYHPRCRDSHTTYFPEISTADDTWTKKELEDIGLQAKQEARQQYTERQIEKYERLAKYSLDEEKQRNYRKKTEILKRAKFKTGNMNTKEYAESKRPLADFKAVPQDQVVAVLRKDSEEWINGLSKEEYRAIRKYTYNSGDKKPNRFFERLNAMLRGDASEDKKLLEYAETISGALKKNKLKQDVICYRNMEFNPYEKYPVGQIFADKQFISTSITSKAALDKQFKITLLVPKGSRCAYIENISKYPKQKELLIDKDCKMRILSKQKDNILLEVIL